MALYSGTLPTQDTMGRAVERCESTLSTPLASGVTTGIPVVDGSRFPASGGAVNIVINGTTSELVYYTSKTGNTLNGTITRGVFSTDSSHLIGARVVLSNSSRITENITDEVAAIAAALGTNIEGAFADADARFVALESGGGGDPLVLSSTAQTYSIAIPEGQEIRLDGVSGGAWIKGMTNDKIEFGRTDTTQMFLRAGGLHLREESLSGGARYMLEDELGGDAGQFQYVGGATDVLQIGAADNLGSMIQRIRMVTHSAATNVVVGHGVSSIPASTTFHVDEGTGTTAYSMNSDARFVCDEDGTNGTYFSGNATQFNLQVGTTLYRFQGEELEFRGTSAPRFDFHIGGSRKTRIEYNDTAKEMRFQATTATLGVETILAYKTGVDQAQVSIGVTSIPTVDASLNLQDSDAALVFNRGDGAARDAITAIEAMGYWNTDVKRLQTYDGTDWGIIGPRFLYLGGSQFRKGATAPTDVTLGSSPTIQALHFDATNELVTADIVITPDYVQGTDLTLGLSIALSAGEINLDTLDLTIDYVAYEPGDDMTALASTQLTPSMTVTTAEGLGAGTQYVFTATIDAADATNPIGAATVGLVFEIHLTNTGGVGEFDLIDGRVAYSSAY